MAMPTFTIRQLLEAGIHFGHTTRRWNPQMRPYIFGERNGIHIIDLEQTVPMLQRGLEAIREVAAGGGRVLFVGTKRQAQEVVAEESQRCGMFYVNQRWLGGLLTNFATIQRSLGRLKDIEAMAIDGRYDTLSKKEVAKNENIMLKVLLNLYFQKCQKLHIPRLIESFKFFLFHLLFCHNNLYYLEILQLKVHFLYI